MKSWFAGSDMVRRVGQKPRTVFLFARRVFLVAGIYGVVTLLPLYFMEGALSQRFPPPITHPEQFYGFIGVAIAWQCAFIVIALDIERYRLFIVPAILEKLSFGAATFVLYAQRRVSFPVACAGLIDLLFMTLFILAFRSTRNAED
jgi:hypothetical protein